jgi:hypothetical protein
MAFGGTEAFPRTILFRPLAEPSSPQSSQQVRKSVQSQNEFGVDPLLKAALFKQIHTGDRKHTYLYHKDECTSLPRV